MSEQKVTYLLVEESTAEMHCGDVEMQRYGYLSGVLENTKVGIWDIYIY